MYNADLKERFLKQVNWSDDTKTVVRFRFKTSAKTEEQLGKDIYDFSTSEIESLLYSYSFPSKHTANAIVSYLRTYMEFCISENLVRDRINIFDTIDPKKYVSKFAQQNRYLTYEQLKNYEANLVNPQDSIILRLLFIGLCGQQLEEIVNLKLNDVSLSKIIVGEREISIDDETYNLIQEAIEQPTYLRNNGEDCDCKSEAMHIYPNNYIVRVAGRQNSHPASYKTLYTKITNIKKWMSNPFLTANNVWFGGMIHNLQLIKNQKGSLDLDDYVQVATVYGYNTEHIQQLRIKLSPHIK